MWVTSLYSDAPKSKRVRERRSLSLTYIPPSLTKGRGQGGGLPNGLPAEFTLGRCDIMTSEAFFNENKVENCCIY
jgi:hypothetical protein